MFKVPSAMQANNGIQKQWLKYHLILLLQFSIAKIFSPCIDDICQRGMNQFIVWLSFALFEFHSLRDGEVITKVNILPLIHAGSKFNYMNLYNILIEYCTKWAHPKTPSHQWVDGNIFNEQWYTMCEWKIAQMICACYSIHNLLV